jgi:L-methionine (R)-S-oxide reductase
MDYFCKKYPMTFEELTPKINDIVTNVATLRDEKLQKICFLLNENIDYYDWVGFYFRNGEKEELVLGPYVGEPTDHTVIPFGKGICGQVAVSNQNFIVPDVSAQDNYIACSLSVKSEIVVPIFVDGVNIGQIDIDSDVIDAFNEADERFLEYVNSEVAKLFHS